MAEEAEWGPPVQSSPLFSHILEICRENQTVFRDPRPPVYNHRQTAFSSVAKSPSLFSSRDRTQVRPGLDTPGYLLSAVGVLADRPALVRRLFSNCWVSGAEDAHEKHSLYGVWIQVEGIWQEVVIDDRLPFVDLRGELLLASLQSSDPDELWPSLLEKAYFQALITNKIPNKQIGNPYSTLRDLTGLPYTIHEDLRDLDKLWEQLESGIDKPCILIFSSKPQNSSSSGLGSDEIYPIIDIVNLQQQGEQNQRLIKLKGYRNAETLRKLILQGSHAEVSSLEEKLESLKLEDGEFWVSLSQIPNLFASYATFVMESTVHYTSTRLNAPKCSLPQTQAANPVSRISAELHDTYQSSASLARYNSSNQLTQPSYSRITPAPSQPKTISPLAQSTAFLPLSRPPTSPTCSKKHLLTFTLDKKGRVTLNIEQQDPRRCTPIQPDQNTLFPQNPAARPSTALTNATVDHRTAQTAATTVNTTNTSNRANKALLTFVRITVAKIGADGLLFVDSRLCAAKTAFLTDSLPAGRYLVFVETYPWAEGQYLSTAVTALGLLSNSKSATLESLQVPVGLFERLEHMVWTDFSAHNWNASFTTVTDLNSQNIGELERYHQFYF